MTSTAYVSVKFRKWLTDFWATLYILFSDGESFVRIGFFCGRVTCSIYFNEFFQSYLREQN